LNSKNAVLFILLGIFFTLGASAKEIPILFEKPLSPRIANYDIDVRLDIKDKKIYGSEKLIWHNKSNDHISELQFHLYLNAFRNSLSTFMRESGGQHRGHKQNQWGYIEVNSMKLSYGLNEGAAFDLTDDIVFIQPDDGNQDDKTLVRTLLPKPVTPGATIVVKIDFEAKLPEPPFARTGTKKEYFMVGQWFPKIAVYRNHAWNSHQFHSTSEFFADFGVYNVKMTTPDDYIVGATGVEVSVVNNGDGSSTHFYHAEDVHDFSWTCSPEYLEYFTKAQDVDIRLLIQPDHVGQAQRHLDAAKGAVTFFQDQYGDYPFSNLTVVDPRRGAQGSGGMEYPTLITAGTTYKLPNGIRSLEHVIHHEFGHNYWYHLLASNEFEESWMDEGINSYTDLVYAEHNYQNMVDMFGFKLPYLTINRFAVMMGGDRDSIVKKAWEFYSEGSYGVNSYMKTAIVLKTLENYVGADVMNRIMREYVQRWRFKHPVSQDFFDIVNEVSGQDLNWFIQQAFYTPARLDYAIASAYSRKVDKPKGYDFTKSVTADSGATDEEISDEENMEDSETDSLAEDKDSKPPALYKSVVKVRRLQPFIFPVEIEIAFKNGEIIRETWDGDELWKKFIYTKETKVEYATVDPDRKILLDLNFTNNSKTADKQHRGIAKVSGKALFWSQFILAQPELVNILAMLKHLN